MSSMTTLATMTRRYQRIIIGFLVFSIVFYLAFSYSARETGGTVTGGSTVSPAQAPPRPHKPEKTEKPARPVRVSKKPWESKRKEKELVVASLVGDDTSWLDQHFGDWEKNIYLVNDPDPVQGEPLTIPKNKGREAMPFLSYMVDRYDSLPDVSIFIHSVRYQWHNEDPMYDGVPVLKHLQLNHVKDRGYVPLRCTWTMGCPAELKPNNPSTGDDDRAQNERAWASVFRELFPYDKDKVPDVVGAHCSSQFAVSRDKIHSRPKGKYAQIRKWLLETDLDDQISGRVMEYMWHIIFHMPAVDCQDAGECFCQTFGLCNLNCTQGACDKRYILPQYATMPKGWPERGPGENGWPAKGWAD